MHLLSRICPLVALASAVALTACGSSAPGSHHATPSTTGVAQLGAGFYDRSSPPPPEGTVTPKPGSFDGVHPRAGYRVVLITAGRSAPTQVLVSAVKTWADEQHVELTTIVSPGSDQLIPSISKAIARKPDLIISAGDALVDPLATVTASNLHQQFLLVGAELAEPTSNVTAADWKGASFRGEGLGTSSTYDATSFTADRAGHAVRAGVAAVLNGLTGIVVWIS